MTSKADISTHWILDRADVLLAALVVVPAFPQSLDAQHPAPLRHD
jgi:hypothetical protein